MAIRRYLVTLIALALIGSFIFWISRNISRSTQRNEALALAEQEKYDEALPKLRRVLDQNPDDVEVLQKLVECTIALHGLMTDTEPFLNRWCALSKDDPKPFSLRLDMLFTFGRLEEALADARHILELSPDRHETRWVAAQIYRDLGRFEEAKQECDRLLEANARNLQEVQALEAQILIGAGELESAAKLLDSLLAQRPGYEPALMYRGMVYFNQGQFAEAVKALEKIRWATIPKLRQIGLYYLALSLGRLGKDAESKEAFAALANDQRAVRFQSDALQEPNDWVLQVRAARALIAARYDDLAIQILDRGLSRNGGNYDALVLLAECHEKKGRKTLAEQYRQKARGLQK